MCISLGVFTIKNRKKADLDRPLRTKLLLLGQISMSVLRSSFRRVAGRFLVTRYGNLQIPCAREIVLIGSTGKIWRPFGPVELELSFQFFFSCIESILPDQNKLENDSFCTVCSIHN